MTAPGVALITGVGGQDGSYLADLLLEQGQEVWGIVRRPVSEYPNLAHLVGSIGIVDADILDQASLAEAIRATGAREIYNLASPSFVPRSWDEPVLTAEFAAVGVTSLLEAVRAGRLDDPRLPGVLERDLRRAARRHRRARRRRSRRVTPYGVAKAYGHFIVESYRRRYGMFASCGILYNHESPRRPARLPAPQGGDVCRGDLARARAGAACSAISTRGATGATRGDYVRAMWLMLQQDEPDDYVVATGESHSVQDLVECAFDHVGLDWRDHVRSDPALRRGTAELHHLVGDRHARSRAARVGADASTSTGSSRSSSTPSSSLGSVQENEST